MTGTDDTAARHSRWVVENESFYSRKIVSWCESDLVNAAFETLCNLDDLQMVRRKFVDKMINIIIKFTL